MDVCSRLHFGHQQIGIVDPEICSLNSGGLDMVARVVGGIIGRIVIVVIAARDVVQIEWLFRHNCGLTRPNSQSRTTRQRRLRGSGSMMTAGSHGKDSPVHHMPFLYPIVPVKNSNQAHPSHPNCLSAEGSSTKGGRVWWMEHGRWKQDKT